MIVRRILSSLATKHHYSHSLQLTCTHQSSQTTTTLCFLFITVTFTAVEVLSVVTLSVTAL